MRAPLRRLMLSLALCTAAALALPLAACSSPKPGPPLRVPTKKRPAAKHSHIFVVVMENKKESQVVGSGNAPYFNKLTKRSALLRNMHGISHPSLPNYLAMVSGSTHGIHDDCTSCHVSGRTVVDQLQESGRTWKGYMEDMPRPCFTGASRKAYAKKHDPFLYFDGIRNDPSRCRRVVPYTRLSKDLFARKVPDFSFIAPNLCDDTHDCPVRTGDRFLAHLVPALLKEVGPHGFVAITWDEGADESCCGGLAKGGRVPALIAGPDVRRGSRPTGAYSHYSLLRTIEDAYGLLPLGGAGDSRTQPLDAAFKTPPRLASNPR